ncbi:MAG TPA: GNAT family N-acetyltransferase [Ktedonobacteraceae bacterium]|nr:GNAT family N-acetyltransferase [Ktedonobacteraceae bacterium]
MTIMPLRRNSRQPLVGEAKLHDVRRLNSIRAAGWRQAYGGLPGVTDEWLRREVDSITDDSAAQRRLAGIRSAKEGGGIFYRTVRLPRFIGMSSVVGYIEGRKGVIFDGQVFQELHTLQIKKQYQGCGLGSLLVRELDAWLDPQQPTIVAVAHDTPARHFYAAHGFKDYGYRDQFGPVVMNMMVRPAMQPAPAPETSLYR